jgi:CRISPR-associated endonuclease Cas1
MAQVQYGQLPVAKATAANILDRKCQNCISLLRKHHAYQRRYPDRSVIIRQCINHLKTLKPRFSQPSLSRQQLFLVEAQAARHWWRAISLLINHHDSAWRRRYPRATDPINLLFNTGYTILARWIRDIVVAAGMLPQIGVLHAVGVDREPLVYDIVEVFRQPVVDAVVLTFLGKKKRPLASIKENDMARCIHLLQKRWKQPIRYETKCVPFQAVAAHEVTKLAQAIVAGEAWKPYSYPWGHGWSCQHYRARNK